MALGSRKPWLCPLQAAASGRVGSAPHLGNTVSRVGPVEGVSEHALREGEENFPHLLLFADLGELAGQCWRDLLGNEEGELAG